jgi:hypothetical protein
MSEIDHKVKALELANQFTGEAPEKIVARATAYHAFLTGGAAAKPAAAAAATKPATTKPATTKPAATAPAAAGKPATVTAPAGKPATTKPAATKPAATAPKAQVGKYTEDQVRAKIREVASNEALGKQEALDILDENGNVQNVSQLKPENYDKVYEACQAALNAIPGSEATDDAAGAGEEFDPTA